MKIYAVNNKFPIEIVNHIDNDFLFPRNFGWIKDLYHISFNN